MILSRYRTLTHVDTPFDDERSVNMTSNGNGTVMGENHNLYCIIFAIFHLYFTDISKIIDCFR